MPLYNYLSFAGKKRECASLWPFQMKGGGGGGGWGAPPHPSCYPEKTEHTIEETLQTEGASPTMEHTEHRSTMSYDVAKLLMNPCPIFHHQLHCSSGRTDAWVWRVAPTGELIACTAKHCVSSFSSLCPWTIGITGGPQCHSKNLTGPILCSTTRLLM